MGDGPPCLAAAGALGAIICVSLCDALSAGLSIAFLIFRIAQSESSYAFDHSQLEKALPFTYFLPLLIILMIWLITLMAFGVSLKLVLPYLVLPYLTLSVLVLGIALSIFVYSVICLVQFLNSGRALSLEFCILLATTSIFCLFEAYSLSVKYAAFKNIVKRKKAVHGNCSEKPQIAEVVDPFDSFSRRSTIIITDDYYAPPPSV
ncbi:unnamed protein product, partial [Mesorhabditis belari]|uniref:Uncharacterized protein n=1 Tax=Mesorhabditis belari TaxID=2138241 RepID=A0AAF3EZA3_9BILA